MAYSFVTDGIPILYYGTCHQSKMICELNHSQDKSKAIAAETILIIVKRKCNALTSRIFRANTSRRMWLSGFQTSGMPLVAHVQGLNKARKLAMSVNMDFLTTPVRILLEFPDIYWLITARR